jgi:uncharacterized membrane protein YczE
MLFFMMMCVAIGCLSFGIWIGIQIHRKYGDYPNNCFNLTKS